jgi:hypothetical protein
MSKDHRPKHWQQNPAWQKLLAQADDPSQTLQGEVVIHTYRLSYGWTKRVLQDAGLLKRAEKRGAHRRKRLRKPLPGMLLHQDGSRHHRVPDVAWDLIVTMDDATLKFAPSVGTRNLVLMFTKATVFSRGVQINYPSPTPARLSSGAIVSRVTPGPPATAHSG